MRYMIIVKATKDSETGVMSEEKLIAEMAEYHEKFGECRHAPGRLRFAAEFAGRAHPVFRRKTHLRRWTVCRDEGTRCRLHGSFRLSPGKRP